VVILVQHGGQNMKLADHRSSCGRFFKGVFRRVEGGSAALSALGTLASAFIAAGALVVATFAFLDPRAPR
jgi:hypothetical protein